MEHITLFSFDLKFSLFFVLICFFFLLSFKLSFFLFCLVSLSLSLLLSLSLCLSFSLFLSFLLSFFLAQLAIIPRGRDEAFMERLQGLAKEALSWPFLEDQQRLMWAAVVEFHAVPTQEHGRKSPCKALILL